MLVLFPVVTLAPSLISGHNFGSFPTFSLKSWQIFKRLFFWFSVTNRGTNFAETHFIFKSSISIHWHELQDKSYLRNLINGPTKICIDCVANFFKIFIISAGWSLARSWLVLTWHFTPFETWIPLVHLSLT